MGSFLVVANKTLGGESLAMHLRKVIDKDPDASFVVVVPFTGPVPVDVGGAMGGIAVLDIETEQYLELAARRRLETLLGWFKLAGVEAQGEIVRSDPVSAMERAAETHKFDEIIISTLPERISRWLRMDLVHRASRKFDLPITTVIGTSTNESLPAAEALDQTNTPTQEPSTEKSKNMAESVYKIIELVGTSTESWEKAAAAAVSKAALTLRDFRVAEIAQLDLVIADGVVSAYRAKIKVSFKYGGDDD